MIRFIHAADFHLDRPFEGLSELPGSLHERVKESTFRALDRLIDRTLAEKPEFLIIAGDVFDDSHRSLSAQRRFIRAMEALREADLPVYLVFGNHDHLDDPWNRLKFPDNVHVFPATPTMLPFVSRDGQRVNLYGFSYAQRSVPEDMAAGYEKQSGADYHIGILHGALRSGDGENAYAPFTVSELTEKNFDFWALGHIHKRQQLSPTLPIWYPGDLQGLSIKETGEKGASVVEIDKQGSRVHFFPTADILWKKKKLELEGDISADRLEAAVEKIKAEARRDHVGIFLRIEFLFSSTAQTWNSTDLMIHELTDAINDGEESRDDFVWLLPGTFSIKPEWDRGGILESPHFVGDVFRLIEHENNVTDAVSLLFDHHSGLRYLNPVDKEELSKIQEQAEQLIADSLFTDKSS